MNLEEVQRIELSPFPRAWLSRPVTHHCVLTSIGGDGGIRTHGAPNTGPDGLANRSDKPLCHVSKGEQKVQSMFWLGDRTLLS